MAAEMIIAPVIDKSVDFVFTRTYQELQYLWKFKSNIESLSRTLTNLERRREAISLLIDAAKNNAEVIGPDVEEWVQQVEMMKNEVEEIIRATRNAQMGCFFNCKCPNMKARYSLSKKAATMTIEIADLQGKGEFSRVGYPAPIGQRPFTSALEVFGFESRLQVEDLVIKALLDDKIHVIAICGMGGVGKTTMVKKIADEIKKDKHFDEVVMAVVSQDHDLIKVQQQLAEKLGQTITETTLDARADRLHTRLMDQGKKILLIIDDLWKEIDLQAIGIPSEGEREGLKVLLTSRFLRVCSKIDVKKIIEVGLLTNEEAWGLFKKHANISDVDSEVLKGYPRKVADKCQGLPLAIEIIGKTLKDNKYLSDWEDALLGLENAQVSDTSEDMHDKVYSRIAWSVNHLQSQCMSLLLLCSLFPEDYEIEVEDLVRFAKGLQLFGGVDKMFQTRDRVERVIHELTDCYLLIACDDHCVKLHDVVRETCLRIASKGDNNYLVSHSRLKEWPDKDTYEFYTSISLKFDALNDLPARLKCSRLQLLILSFDKSKSVDIVTSFLQATERLRVLNINNSWIKRLPQSLQASISLRTLNLHNCYLDGDLSALLGSLVKVEVLSFYDSKYNGKWPEEIAELTNLKSLDLRFDFPSFPSESFPTAILHRLNKLEELYLGCARLESYDVIKEMGSLNTFEILRTKSDELAVLVENLNVERLLRFSISSSYEQRYQFSRKMIVHDTNIDMLLKPKMKVLLSKVDEYLELKRVTRYIEDFDGGSVFCCSRILNLRHCGMKYIWNTTNSHTGAGVAVHLNKLYIEEAEHLEELCHGKVPPGSFARLEEVSLFQVPRLSCLWGPIKPPCLGNLTSLVIEGSKMITSLFLWSSVKCFAQLRVIEIGNCCKLESLVSFDAHTEKDTVEHKAVFPESKELQVQDVDSFKIGGEFAERVFHTLDSLSLRSLPNLRHPWINLPEGTIAFRNLTTLNISFCGSLKHLLTPSLAEMLVSLKTLSIGFCKQLEAIVGLDEMGVSEKISTSNCLIMQEGTVAFQKLTSLSIINCQSLKHLLPQKFAKMLVNLETLYIESCNELESIVGPEEFSTSNCHILQEGTVAFQNLKTLSFKYCRSLKHLLPPHIAKMLVNLETLYINSCDDLESIVGPEEFSVSNRLSSLEGTVAFQYLTTLSISFCGCLKHLFTPSMAKKFASLKSLEIFYCNEFVSIVGIEETGPSENVSECKGGNMLDRLEVLELWGLPQLRNFGRMFPEGTIWFQKLITLKIRRCEGLRYLLTRPMVKMFANLRELEIESCDQLESIIGSEEVDEAKTNEIVHAGQEILLPQLCRLELKDLPEFKILCSQSFDLALPSWNEFSICNCPRINRFCDGNLISPELKQVGFSLGYNQKFYLDLETMRKWFKDCELGKCCINCAASAIETCDHLTEITNA